MAVLSDIHKSRNLNDDQSLYIPTSIMKSRHSQNTAVIYGIVFDNGIGILILLLYILTREVFADLKSLAPNRSP